MSVVRESLAGTSAHFHLVGIYTLLDLVVRIAFTEANASPEEYGFLFVTAAFLALMASFGILGLVVHAAAGRGQRPPFPQIAALLFLPLLWLQIKIALLTYGPVLAGLLSFHALYAGTVPFETWAPVAAYWIEPIAEAATLALTVFATPFAVRQRVTGKPGAAVREGLRLMCQRPKAARVCSPCSCRRSPSGRRRTTCASPPTPTPSPAFRRGWRSWRSPT